MWALKLFVASAHAQGPRSERRRNSQGRFFRSLGRTHVELEAAAAARYGVDEACKGLAALRPGGAFFADAMYKRAEGPSDKVPGARPWAIASSIPGARFHMASDAAHYALIAARPNATDGRGRGLALDVGANQGFYTYFLAALGYEVHAFEIGSANYAALQHGALYNSAEVVDRTNVYAVGLSSEVGRARLRSGGYEGFLRPDRGGPPGPILSLPLDCFSYHLVSRRRGGGHYADALASRGVDIIKLDVEGFEAAVISGAHRTLDAHRVGAMLVEVGPARWGRAGVSLAAGMAEIVYLASKFETSYVLLRSSGSHARTCPRSLASFAGSQRPAAVMKIFLHEIRDAVSFRALLAEMQARGYDCNFWFVNEA